MESQTLPQYFLFTLSRCTATSERRRGKARMLVIVAFLIILLKSGNIKGQMELHAFSNQTTNCNARMDLQCNISSSIPLHFNEIYWKKHEASEFKCDAKSNSSPPGFECSYTKEALTLTILHSTPAKMGRYFCCIKANAAYGYKEINVSLERCIGEFSYEMSGPKHLQCSFTGVYPVGTINWFHSDKNMTSNSNVSILDNPDGTFNITSVLNIQDSHDRYNCSLWSLKHGQNLKDQEFEVAVNAGISHLSGISTHHCFSWTLLLLTLLFSLRTCLPQLTFVS